MCTASFSRGCVVLLTTSLSFPQNIAIDVPLRAATRSQRQPLRVMSSQITNPSIEIDQSTNGLTGYDELQLSVDMTLMAGWLDDLNLSDESNISSELRLRDLAARIKPILRHKHLSQYTIIDLDFVWKRLRTVIHHDAQEIIMAEQTTLEAEGGMRKLLQELTRIGNRWLNLYGNQLGNPEVRVKPDNGDTTLTWWTRDKDKKNVIIASSASATAAERRPAFYQSTQEFLDTNKLSADDL